MNGKEHIFVPQGLFGKSKKNKGLNRALKIEIPDEIYDKLNNIIDTN